MSWLLCCSWCVSTILGQPKWHLQKGLESLDWPQMGSAETLLTAYAYNNTILPWRPSLPTHYQGTVSNLLFCTCFLLGAKLWDKVLMFIRAWLPWLVRTKSIDKLIFQSQTTFIHIQWSHCKSQCCNPCIHFIDLYKSWVLAYIILLYMCGVSWTLLQLVSLN